MPGKSALRTAAAQFRYTRARKRPIPAQRSRRPKHFPQPTCSHWHEEAQRQAPERQVSGDAGRSPCSLPLRQPQGPCQLHDPATSADHTVHRLLSSRPACRQTRVTAAAAGTAQQAPKVVLTREAGKNDKLREALEPRGFRCMELPLIEHADGPDRCGCWQAPGPLLPRGRDSCAALNRLQAHAPPSSPAALPLRHHHRQMLPELLRQAPGIYDWVTITSPEAAAVFLEAWTAAGRPKVRCQPSGLAAQRHPGTPTSTCDGFLCLGLEDPPTRASLRTSSALPQLRLAAVGGGTAEALSQGGMKPEYVPSKARPGWASSARTESHRTRPPPNRLSRRSAYPAARQWPPRSPALAARPTHPPVSCCPALFRRPWARCWGQSCRRCRAAAGGCCTPPPSRPPQTCRCRAWTRMRLASLCRRHPAALAPVCPPSPAVHAARSLARLQGQTRLVRRRRSPTGRCPRAVRARPCADAPGLAAATQPTGRGVRVCCT
jgi:uroporphyrinogen-III synthase